MDNYIFGYRVVFGSFILATFLVSFVEVSILVCLNFGFLLFCQSEVACLLKGVGAEVVAIASGCAHPVDVEGS